MDINVSLEELYALIGEREVLKFKLGEQQKQLLQQISEMSDEITRLRTERNQIAEERQELKRMLNELTQDGA